MIKGERDPDDPSDAIGDKKIPAVQILGCDVLAVNMPVTPTEFWIPKALAEVHHDGDKILEIKPDPDKIHNFIHVVEYSAVKSEARNLLERTKKNMAERLGLPKDFAIIDAHINEVDAISELSAAQAKITELEIDRDRWKRNADKKANYITELLDEILILKKGRV